MKAVPRPRSGGDAEALPAPVHTWAPSLEGRVWRETTRRLGPYAQDRSPRAPTGWLPSPRRGPLAGLLQASRQQAFCSPPPASLETHGCCCLNRGGRPGSTDALRVQRLPASALLWERPRGRRAQALYTGLTWTCHTPSSAPLSSTLLPECTLSVSHQPPAPAAVTGPCTCHSCPAPQPAPRRGCTHGGLRELPL